MKKGEIDMKPKEFRAWDRKYKKMTCPFTLYDLTVQQSDIIITNRTMGGKYHKLKNCDVMEYIGQRDKNNQKIYENDCLVWTTIIDGEEKSSANHVVIKWNNRRSHFNMPNPTVNKLKIIGNTYENPELVKEDAE